MKTHRFGWMLLFLLVLAGGVATGAESLEDSDRSRIVFFVH